MDVSEKHSRGARGTEPLAGHFQDFLLECYPTGYGSELPRRSKTLNFGSDVPSPVSLPGMEEGAGEALLSVEKEITNTFSSY